VGINFNAEEMLCSDISMVYVNTRDLGCGGGFWALLRLGCGAFGALARSAIVRAGGRARMLRAVCRSDGCACRGCCFFPNILQVRCGCNRVRISIYRWRRCGGV